MFSTVLSVCHTDSGIPSFIPHIEGVIMYVPIAIQGKSRPAIRSALSFPSSAMKPGLHCQSASVVGSSSDDPESSFLIESLRIMNFTEPFMSSLIPEKLS